MHFVSGQVSSLQIWVQENACLSKYHQLCGRHKGKDVYEEKKMKEVTDTTNQAKVNKANDGHTDQAQNDSL